MAVGSGGLIANQLVLISQHLRDIGVAVRDRQGTGETLSSMAALAGAQLGAPRRRSQPEISARAQGVDRDDDAIDKLNHEIFEAALELEDAADERELALRHGLIARSLARVGENPVDIAEQAAFLVTAQLREFSNASHPEPRRGNATR